MDKLWIITKMILKRTLRKPTSILMHLVMPVAASIGLFLLVGLSTGSQLSIAIIDHDYSSTSTDLISIMESTSGLSLKSVSKYDLNETVSNREVVLGVKISTGFEDRILNGEEPEVTFVSLGKSNNSNWLETLIKQEIKNYMTMASVSSYSKDDYQMLLTNVIDGHVKLDTLSVVDESIEKSGLIRTFGVYMLLLMISTFTIAFKILDEKSLGTYTRIGMSSVHPRIYTLANILSGILIAIIQISLALIGLKLVGVNFYTSIVNLFIVLMSFATCGISLGVLIATFSRNSNEANASIGLILSPSCMIAGCLWPLEFMPEFMQKIAYLMPQRWVLDAIKLLQRERQLIDILPNLLVVLGFTTLFFLLSVYKIKTKDQYYV